MIATWHDICLTFIYDVNRNQSFLNIILKMLKGYRWPILKRKEYILHIVLKKKKKRQVDNKISHSLDDTVTFN